MLQRLDLDPYTSGFLKRLIGHNKLLKGFEEVNASD
jgi:hypothetical protein